MWSLSNRTRHLSSLLRCSSPCPLLFFVGPVPLLRWFSFIRHFNLGFRRQNAVDDTAPKRNINEPCTPRLMAMAVNEYNNDICRRSAQSHAPYTVFIEGNVGSGKTTFLEQFSDCPDVFMAKEPVHKWQDVCGHNFLVSVAVKIGNRVYFSILLTSIRFRLCTGSDVSGSETLELCVPVDRAEDYVGIAPSPTRTRAKHQNYGTVNIQRQVYIMSIVFQLARV